MKKTVPRADSSAKSPEIEYSNSQKPRAISPEKHARNSPLRWILLGVLLVVVVALAATIGAPVPFADLWSHDAARVAIARHIFWREDGFWSGDWGLRPLRICAGLLVGAALASSGACLQSVFRNPLAEPYLLGVSSGGALGATIGLSLRNRVHLGFELSTTFAFFGALAASALIYFLGAKSSTRNRNISANRGVLLLTGVALSAFLSAIMALILALGSDHDLASQVLFWTLGTLTRATATQNFLLLIVLIIGLATLIFSARDLNALRAGDEEAATLGVDVRALHLRLIVVSALMSAVAVAACGIIGFIGLLAPHLARRVFGGDIRVLVPAAAFGGAILLVGCDAVARSIAAPVELPVGILTSLLGVPLFLALARKS